MNVLNYFFPGRFIIPKYQTYNNDKFLRLVGNYISTITYFLHKTSDYAIIEMLRARADKTRLKQKIASGNELHL